MMGKYLIAVVVLAGICSGVVAVYVWQGGQTAQTGENTQSGVENVELSYLAEHIAEYENKKIRTSGTVESFYSTEMVAGFLIKSNGMSVLLNWQPDVYDYPSEGSAVTLTGEIRHTEFGAGYFYIYADNWFQTALTLQELLEDFENILGFRSYSSGDVVKVRDTVENTLLVSEPGWWEGMLYENTIENTYNASYPITLIVMESCAENIWQNPVSQLGGGKVIGLEGDVRDNYEIGEEVTIFIHIEKHDNTETARELGLGSLLWDLIYWID
jgi:hypothetical protein